MFQVPKTKKNCREHVWGILEVTTVSTTGEKSAYTIRQCKKCFAITHVIEEVESPKEIKYDN